jgi:hypothetical protein
MRKIYSKIKSKGTARLVQIAILVMLGIGNVWGQVSAYTFSESVGTYTAITGGTSLASCNGCGTTFDVNTYAITLPTGSQFPFNGTNITAVTMLVDGSLIIGTSTGASSTGPIASSQTANGIIAGLGMDLRNTTISGQNWELRWQDVGTEVVFQWTNASRWAQETVERFSFQIRINETTGAINIVYGNMTSIAASTTYQPQVGLRGSANTDYLSRRLTNTIPDATPNWGAPNGTTAATSNAHTCRFHSTASCFPASGLTYTFTPPPCPNLPSTLTSNAITTTTANIAWTAASPAPGSGYEYFVSTSATTPVSGTTPTGSVGAGIVTAALSSLSVGTQYYFWVRSNCNGTDKSSWVGSGTFTTQILVATPYSEPFTTTTTPSGWGITGWTIGSIRGVTGNPGNNIYKNLYNLATTGTFTTINVGPISSGQLLTFDWKTADYTTFAAPGAGTGDFVVSISTDWGATYTTINTTSTGANNTWNAYSYNLSSYAGQNVKIRIVGNWVSGDYDLAFDNFKIETPPSCLPPTITATTSIAANTATINWTAPSPAPSNGYQWEVRSSGAAGSGATGLAASGSVGAGVLTASATGLTASTPYTVYVRSDCGGSGFSTWASGGAFTTLCSAPSVTGTTPATRCGTGTVTLAATASSGTLRWFKAATADTLRGTGASFVTPSIASTTDYYVEAAAIGTTSFGGKLTPETSWTGSTFSDWGIVFNVLKEGTLNSVDVYSSAAGTLNVKIVNSSNTELYSTGNVSVTNGGTTTPTTIPLNYSIGVGTGYKVLVKASSGVSLIRGSTNLAFPYTNSDLSITSSEWGGTTTANYYYFHNFNFSPVCASARTLVTATVTPAPALALDSPNFTICKGATSTAVSVTPATLPDYNTFSWTPTTGVSSPSSSSTTFSPSATTTYTLNASHSGTGCARSLTRTITMADTPSRLTLSQGFVKPKCDARIDSLMASGGLVPQSGKIGSGTATNTLSTPFKRFWGGSRAQALYTASELTALGMSAGSQISSIGWVIQSGTPASMADFTVNIGWVAASTLGSSFITGANTNIFSNASYTPPTGSGNIDFSFTPITWDGTSNLLIQTCFNNNDGGGISANSLSSESSTVASGLNLYLSIDNNATVCTNTTAPTSTTTRPNLRITYSAPNITWSPNGVGSGLFTDRAASAPYSSGHAAKLYSKPSTTTKYYAQAQNGICIVRDSIIDSAKATTDMVILALGSASGASAQCTDGGWTYYGTASDPDKLIFAIQKGAWTNGNETVTIGVNGSPYSSSLTTNGPNQHHQSWLMGRDWDVTVSTQPSTPVLVRFYYDPADTTAVNTDRDAAFAALPAGTIAVKTPFEWFKTTNVPYNAGWRSSIVGNKFPATHIKLTPTYGTQNGVNYAEFSVASFSGGTGGAGFGPSGGGGVGLPVTWAGFDVNTEEVGNELTWKTASEQNTDYFEVQYSYDAKEFIAIPDHIPAAGNSADLRTYNFIHADFAPYVYYRIKQVDLDGKYDYSAIKLAKRAAGPSFVVNVFPIPMQEDNLLHVSAKGIDKSAMSITMTDITGKVIRHLSYIPSSESIKESFDMSPLTPGFYFIEVQNGQGKETFKVSR